MDANLLHVSYEGGILEDPDFEPEDSMWRITVSPEKAPARPEHVELEYRKGDIVAVNGRKMTPAQVLTKLNQIGGRHGVGRLDIVENRYVGMKSRGCYETPGGTIMLKAHRAIESITLDREVLALKDDLMPRYARMIYNGYWFSPERLLLQSLIDKSQQTVNGTVRLKLYKGTVLVVGRASRSDSLFDSRIATFDDDKGAYNQADAAGFIRLNALRLRIGAKRRRNVAILRQSSAWRPGRKRRDQAVLRKDWTMPSFDIVSEVNQVELRNALDQTNKEVSNRFDFKGSDARVEHADKVLTVFADDDFKLGTGLRRADRQTDQARGGHRAACSAARSKRSAAIRSSR